MSKELKQNAVATVDKKSPAHAVRKYNLARSNLFTAILLTIINILLGCVGANVYLLFSITFPYMMFDIRDIVFSIPAIVVLGVFIVYYICSKKKPGFMIAALVTFILDFAFLILYSLFIIGFSEFEITFADFIIDYLTHIWVLVYLIIGTRYTRRYRAAIRENPELLEGSAFRNAAIPEEAVPDTEDPFAEYNAEFETESVRTEDNSSEEQQ